MPLISARGRLKSPPQSLQPPSARPINPFSFTHRVIRPVAGKPASALGLRLVRGGQPRKPGSFDPTGTATEESLACRGEAFSRLCANLGGCIPFDCQPVRPCGTAFRCLASHWPGTRPRRATFFFVVRQRRQENVPRCRAPFGGSLLPAMPGGVFANSPCGLKHAKPFFRPSSPPVGTSEGTRNAGDQWLVALSASGEAR